MIPCTYFAIDWGAAIVPSPLSRITPPPSPNLPSTASCFSIYKRDLHLKSQPTPRAPAPTPPPPPPSPPSRGPSTAHFPGRERRLQQHCYSQPPRHRYPHHCPHHLRPPAPPLPWYPWIHPCCLRRRCWSRQMRWRRRRRGSGMRRRWRWCRLGGVESVRWC